jgi:hypothetical protein
MLVCGFFFGLVKPRSRARFENSSFFGAVLTFWTGAGRCSVGRWHRRRDRDDEIPAVGKNLFDRQGEPIGFCGPDESVASRCHLLSRRGVVRCRTVRYRLARTQEENRDWQGRVLHCLRASGIRAQRRLSLTRAFVHSLGRLLSLLASRGKESYQVSA